MEIITQALLISSMVLLAGAAISALMQIFGGRSSDHPPASFGLRALTFVPTGLFFIGYVVLFGLWLVITA